MLCLGLLDVLVDVSFINCFPEVERGRPIVGVLCHSGSHHSHPWQSPGDFRSLFKCLLGSPRIMPVNVMDEAESEVKSPVRWVLSNPFFHQGHCLIRLASSIRGLLA